jgi:Rifampin ADP-ribosyl transferase
MHVTADESPFLRVSRFVSVSEGGALLERSRQSLDGTRLGEVETDRVTWADLRAHASFPVEATTIEDETISTAIGDLDCLRYTVRDGESENVFWFAKSLPGMPIQSLTRLDGSVVSTVTLVDNTIQAEDSGPFFHGTKADLSPGDFLEPGYGSDAGSGSRADFIHLTATLETAAGGRIYRVEPTGPFEDDPNLTDQKSPGNPTRSYRTRAALRVVAEVRD